MTPNLAERKQSAREPMTPAFIAFDVDGVLIATDALHEDALNIALSMVQAEPLSHDEHLARWKGLPTTKKLAALVQEGRLTTVQATRALHLKQARTLELLPNVEVDPRAAALLSTLRNRGARLCAVSNAVRDTVAAMLERTGVTALLDFWLCNEDAEPKPSPALYQLAAARFGITPTRLVVVEDGAPGIAAATTAGCRVVVVRGPEDVTLDLLRRLEEAA